MAMLSRDLVMLLRPSVTAVPRRCRAERMTSVVAVGLAWRITAKAPEFEPVQALPVQKLPKTASAPVAETLVVLPTVTAEEMQPGAETPSEKLSLPLETTVAVP